MQQVGCSSEVGGCADQELLEGCSCVVYRVKECSCCSEIEEMEPGQAVVVNLLLARPCARLPVAPAGG